MRRRHAVVVAVAVLAAAAALLGWHHHRGGAGGRASGAAAAARGGAVEPAHELAGHPPPAWLGQAGAPWRRVAGRVTYQGAPVAGASVRLELAGALRAVLPPLVIATDAAGAFDLGGFPAAAVVVTASAAGRGPAGVELDLRDPTRAPPPDQLELVLTACDHAVHGNVHDGAGGPLVGAELRARADHAIAVTAADAHGDYELCVAAGGVELSAEADGYGRGLARVGSARRARQDFELSPEVVLAGTVVDAAGQPVAGALVSAARSDFDPFAEDGGVVAVSDGSGRFSLGGITTGRYALSARDPGRATAEPVEVIARVGEPVEDAVLVLAPAATVRGTVVLDGKPVVGAAVHGEHGRQDGVTQSDGRFVLDGLAPGTLILAVDGYEVLEPKQLVVARAPIDVLVKVAARARLRGRVTAGGKPVAGAKVHANSEARNDWHRATTLADGTFELTGLVPGAFAVGAETADAFAQDVDVTVAAGEVKEGVDFSLDLAGTVDGVVVDQHGVAVAGVAVQFNLIGGRDYGFATSEEDGRFSAGAMSGGGDYGVSVRTAAGAELKPPPGTSFPTVAVHDGASHVSGLRIVVELDKLTIAGQVQDDGGAPVADVVVVATAATGDSESEQLMARWQPPVARATSQADGRFVLTDLMAGSYTLRATTGTGLAAEARAIAAGRTGVVLKLPGVGAIEGTLVGFGAGVEVGARILSREAWDRYRAKVDGTHFEIRELPVGQYAVSATLDSGAAAGATVEVTAGKTATVTLTSSGHGTVRGQVLDLVTQQPVEGLNCTWSLDAATPEQWDAVVTDGEGRFTMATPSGKVQVFCAGRGEGGFATETVDVAAGVTATVAMTVVIRRHQRDFGDVGMEPGSEVPATVGTIAPGGPAERAGIVLGDVIVSVDGFTVGTAAPWTVWQLILDHDVGDKATLVIRRGGSEKTVAVEIVARGD